MELEELNHLEQTKNLEDYCSPEIADGVLRLARSSESQERFLAAAALFCRAPQNVLVAVYLRERAQIQDTEQTEEYRPNIEERLKSVERNSEPIDQDQSVDRVRPNSQDRSQNEHLAGPVGPVGPVGPETSDSEFEREWYDSDTQFEFAKVTSEPATTGSDGAWRAGPSTIALYYTDKSPFKESPALIQVIKQPTGTLAQRAKAGSDLVREARLTRERTAAVRSKTAVRGTLAAIDAQKTSLDTTTQTRSRPDLVRGSLPAFAARDDLLHQIRENQVVVVIGETGSGKTTQIPQFLLDAGYAAHGIIACTQPRRVAAMSVAERVAAERGVDLGNQVGYTIRFEDKTSPATRIKFLTDGILLREALADHWLDQYSCIIIDEAHERALNTDLLLGFLKRVLARRTDLKLVITSATINSTLFSNFFGGAPVFTIPGRTYPVQVTNIKSPVADYVQAAVNQALSIHLRAVPGDILVFMTGQDDIEATCDQIHVTLEKLDAPPPLDVLPIYSQLPADLQAKIFLPSENRKVVVATNIAETSLTVEGIKHVIDTGYTKLKVFQPRYGIDTLQLVPISRANAAQRAGRAGRTSEGYAYRLYTKLAEHDEMHEQPMPEILRTNLANTLLVLKGLGIENVDSFDFLDAPDPASVQSSLKDLWTISAIDSSGKLTELGSRLTHFPLDPFLARMLVASIDKGCSTSMLTIIAMISAPSVFVRTNERAKEADSAHEKFQNPESDHLTLLNIFNEWTRHGESSKWCKTNFFHPRALKYAKNIRLQLERMVPRTSRKLPQSQHEAVMLRKCICMAYFSQSARAKGLQTFVGFSNGVEMALHPTSALNGLGHVPSYVVYHSVVLTSRQLMSLVTAVEPEWLLEYGSTLFSSSPEETRAEPALSEPKPKFKRRKLTKPTVNKAFMRGI